MKQGKMLLLFMFALYFIFNFSVPAYTVYAAADDNNYTDVDCYSERARSVTAGIQENDGENAEECKESTFQAAKVTLWKRFDSESAGQRIMTSRDQSFFYFSKTKDTKRSAIAVADAVNRMRDSGKHLSESALSFTRQGKTSSAAAMSAAVDANINTKNSGGRNAILVQIELVIIFAEAAAGGGLGLSIKSDLALLKWYKNRKKGTYTQQ